MAAGCLGLQCAAGVAQSARSDPWQDEAGYEIGFKRAEIVISQCLEQAASTADARPDGCVHSAFLACEREHGTASQRDLNDCAVFSRKAWEKRLDTVRAQLLGAQTIDPKFGRAEPMVEQLRKSERRWREWSEADCEMQAAGSKGGTIHTMLLSLCLSNHAAQRALELEALTFWWEKSFKL